MSEIMETIDEFIEEKKQKKEETGGSLPRAVALRQLKELRSELEEVLEEE